MDQPKIVNLGVDQSDTVTAILQASFVSDPFIRWFLPDADSYRRHYNKLILAFGGKAFEFGTVDVLEDWSAAALWFPPGKGNNEEVMTAAMISLLPAEKMDDLLHLGEKVGAAHPQEPHWYLSTIGVDAAFQGRGRGAILMKERLKQCDEEGVLAYLESSNSQNISFYKRYGFEPISEIEYGATSVLTPMARPAR